ncbi:MAG: hypothetical protein HYU04_01815 [Candidatus Wildermuthbacteria bacterium]|nr:hypothetical protein [Candidatus Wildermuthbacteria bacterium]
MEVNRVVLKISRLDGLLPDLEDPRQNICWGIRDPTRRGPEPDDTFNFEGIVRDFRECVVVYGNNTRDAVFEAWRQLRLSCSHLSGGIGNPMTIEFNLLRGLSGNASLNSRTIGDLIAAIAAIQSTGLPPLFFDYPGAFRRLFDRLPAEKRPSVSFEQVTIAEALAWGAPDYWEVGGPNGILMAKSVSVPFNAVQGFGHFAVERDPEFAGVKLPMILSNTTGARGIDTKAINLLLIALVSGEERAYASYFKEATFTLSQFLNRGVQPPFKKENIEEYAAAFVKSTWAVEKDLARLLDLPFIGRMEGVQYFLATQVRDGLPVGVYPFPPLPTIAPHVFIKTKGRWIAAD